MAKANGNGEAKALNAPKRAQVNLGDLRLREQTNNEWRIISKNATRADVESAYFYAVLVENLRAFDTVQIISQEKVFEVLVLYAEVGRPVLTKLMYEIDLPVVTVRERPELPDGYEIEFEPGTAEYVGRRSKDGHPFTAPHKRWNDAYHELVGHAIFHNQTHA